MIVSIGPRASRPQPRRRPQHAGWRSRGYLPHLDAPNLIQHIVFRLADSLPARVREEIAKVGSANLVETVDASLDQGYGRRDLEIPAIAELVQRALLQFDGERYSLIAWCVMPNHVHTLIETRMGHRLDRVVHAWKSFTAKQANRWLERDGAFWAPEYFAAICAMTLTSPQREPISNAIPLKPACVGKSLTGCSHPHG